MSRVQGSGFRVSRPYDLKTYGRQCAEGAWGIDGSSRREFLQLEKCQQAIGDNSRRAMHPQVHSNRMTACMREQPSRLRFHQLEDQRCNSSAARQHALRAGRRENLKTIKAQVSLEFLTVFAIYLTLLLIAAYSLSNIKTSFESALDKKLLLQLGKDVANSAEEVCFLGKGNVRELEVPSKLGELSVEQSGRQALFFSPSKNISYSLELPAGCRVDILQQPPTLILKLQT